MSDHTFFMLLRKNTQKIISSRNSCPIFQEMKRALGMKNPYDVPIPSPPMNILNEEPLPFKPMQHMFLNLAAVRSTSINNDILETYKKCGVQIPSLKIIEQKLNILEAIERSNIELFPPIASNRINLSGKAKQAGVVDI
ncbi:hypothetical protein C0J52_26814 [Blattella germanica]|nr:hypothetical protein C0J52_26814 [Blattella germanica]